MKYRIDFSRLCRDVDEVIKNKRITDALVIMLKEVEGKRAIESFNNFHNSLPEGHILDTMFVEDDDDLNGLDVLKRKVHPIYPEAKLSGWCEIKE